MTGLPVAPRHEDNSDTYSGAKNLSNCLKLKYFQMPMFEVKFQSCLEEFWQFCNIIEGGIKLNNRLESTFFETFFVWCKTLIALHRQNDAMITML